MNALTLKTAGWISLLAWLVIPLRGSGPAAGSDSTDLDRASRTIQSFNFRAVRSAITDLTETFGSRYPQGKKHLAKLDALQAECRELRGPGAQTSRPPESIRAGGITKLQSSPAFAPPPD